MQIQFVEFISSEEIFVAYMIFMPRTNRFCTPEVQKKFHKLVPHFSTCKTVDKNRKFGEKCFYVSDRVGNGTFLSSVRLILEIYWI